MLLGSSFLNHGLHLSFRPALTCWFLGVLLAANPARSQQPTPAPAPGPDPKAYVNLGISDGAKGDLDAAITAFNQAIQIDPKYAPAYANRGKAYRLQGKLDECLADLNQAIQLDPTNPEAYAERGRAEGLKGNFDGALSDFNHIVQIAPLYPQAYYNTGHVKYFKGDLDGATADLNKAINFDPNSTFSYFIRGLIRHAQDDREGATSDFEKSADSGFPYGAFWLWIVQTENGERGIARQTLSDFMLKPQQNTPGSWTAQVGGFLLEKITQDQLLAAVKDHAQDKDTLCDAWFYIGTYQRLNGDSKGAQESFLKSVATGITYSEAYIEAQRALADLQKQP